MRDDYLAEQITRVIAWRGPMTTSGLWRALRDIGYAGTVGNVTRLCHQRFRRDTARRWRLSSPQQRPPRANGPYGLQRCSHVGRCACRQSSGAIDKQALDDGARRLAPYWR